MFYRLILVQISLFLLLSACTQSKVPDVYIAKFVVVAITDNIDDRTEVENEVSAKLQSHGFDAVPSHQLVSGEFRIQDNSFRKQLINQGVIAILALRPIEVGPDSSIKSVENYVPSSDYSVVEDFVAEYRGDNFTTRGVVEVGGFGLTQSETVKIWQGVVWLDGEVASREAGIAKLSDLILANLQKWRPQLRESAGLPPLK